ncbi:MAG: putative Major facilitator superfamily precursor [Burkholderiaceae bacterium]|nr:putative Major facilitator superfamily precursor [Burkholderiaceae bacterium]
MHLPPLRLSALVWGLAAAFYLFGFFQRVTPASLAPDLMRDFALSAAGLGNLSAFYYYAYAAVQIPTGVLVDRFGPSRMFLGGALLAGAGSLIFAWADTALAAGLGRALIGAAHGVAWVSMLKLVTHWFAPSRFATLSGLSLAVGTLGAVLAGPPLRWLADAFGWRSVIGASGLLALVLAVAIKLAMRDDPTARGFASYLPKRDHDVPKASIAADLRAILRYRNPWLLALVNSGVCGAFLAFTGLWGVPLLSQVHGISVAQASLVTSGMLVLFAAGAPVFGVWSDRLQRRKLPFALGGSLMLAGFAVLTALPAAPLLLLVPVLLAASFGAGSMALSFGFAKESAPLRLQGTATGVVNAGVMLGTLVQMPVIGLILDARWQGVAINGVRQYDVGAFQAGLVFLLAWIAAAVLLLLGTREKPRAGPG